MKRSKLLVAAMSLMLSGCFGDDTPADYMKIAGGGITFNYRYSQANLVVVGKRLAPLPKDASVVALFDVPGEATRQRVSMPVHDGKLTYKLTSKNLAGIKKGVPLKVTLLLVDADGTELDRDEMTRTSDVDQDSLPSEPLTDPSSPAIVPQLWNL